MTQYYQPVHLCRSLQKECLFHTYYHRYIDKQQNSYIKLLEEAVAIKSVSAWPENRPEIRRMVNWVKQVCKWTVQFDCSDWCLKLI